MLTLLLLKIYRMPLPPFRSHFQNGAGGSCVWKLDLQAAVATFLTKLLPDRHLNAYALLIESMLVTWYDRTLCFWQDVTWERERSI